MSSGPGLLSVTAQPHDDLSAAQFHDWYNNEHGPVRLRLPFVVNGFRYRARDHEKPAWLAIYDITDVSELGRPTYTDLREPQNKTQREIETMKRIDVNRRIYNRIYSRQARDMRPDESGPVLLTAVAQVKPEREKDFNERYDTEHTPLLTKVPGWVRSRRYRISSLDGTQSIEYLAVHEFEATNGIGGPEFKATMTPAFAEILSNALTSLSGPFYWDLAYTFGPAPRELGALWDASTSEFASRDGRTRSYPSPSAPAIESYVTTADGVDLAYRLEGAAAADAPLIVLVNSILVDWTIWDEFVTAFLAEPTHKQYRVLRYNARGRTSKAGTQQVSLDLLTQDLWAILDALRVDQVACAIGVSLGGATVLNSALHNSTRVPAFVACDTNDTAPAGNPTAWGERIATAEGEGATHNGEAVVGQQLAEQTVQRWFVEASLSSKTAAVDGVRTLVQHNSLDGFRTAVHALYSYDMRPQMAGGRARALFVVGDGDGVLPQTMQDMARRYGTGDAPLEVIPSAGHLPMVEQPQAFAAAIARFLRGT